MAAITFSEDATFRELGKEAVVLDLAGGRYYGLDDVATRMWQVLAQSGDCETAAGILLGEYEVEEERLRADLNEFVQRLVALGLARREELHGTR